MTTMTNQQFLTNWNSYINEVKKVVVGSDYPLWLAGVGLFSGGHVLYESVPGMGKTVIALMLGAAIKDGKASTFQGTADKLPSDLVGSLVFDQETRQMKTKFGAVNPACNVVLADEINRMPQKTTSALLSIMEERYVLINEAKYDMADPFIMLATENPIEQEGVYPLPEAALDRFALKGHLAYMSRENEIALIKRAAIFERDKAAAGGVQPVLTPEDIRQMVLYTKKQITITDTIYGYIVDLVRATRPECDAPRYMPKDMLKLVTLGASPRAEIWLTACGKAAAALRGSNHVSIEDIKSVAPAVLCHRMALNPAAKFKPENRDLEQRIVKHLLDTVPVAGMSDEAEALKYLNEAGR